MTLTDDVRRTRHLCAAVAVLFVVLAAATLVPLVLWLRAVPPRTREGGRP